MVVITFKLFAQMIECRFRPNNNTKAFTCALHRYFSSSRTKTGFSFAEENLENYERSKNCVVVSRREHRKY